MVRRTEATARDRPAPALRYEAAMPHDAFTRAERRRLRELAGLAYERELGAALAELEAALRAWRAGALTAWEVSNRVHAFHQGPSRRLYGLYHGLKPADAVARALARTLARTLLASGEVPPELVAERAGKRSSSSVARAPNCPRMVSPCPALLSAERRRQTRRRRPGSPARALEPPRAAGARGGGRDVPRRRVAR